MSGHNTPDDHALADWRIPDPGDAGTIRSALSGVCALVSAAAETRTLGAPAYLGQWITLAFDTDGGDITLTYATLLNPTGNNTVTFANAGEVLKLEAITIAGTLTWRPVGVTVGADIDTEGPTLSTV